MKVFIGADHRGFTLKEDLKPWLEEKGVELVDVGAPALTDGDDYVDFAEAVGKQVAADPSSRGIVLCGSGVGVDMVANKIHGIRSGLGISEEQITAARADDDINVLAVASDYTTPEKVKSMITRFLETPFTREERYVRRIERMKALEQ